MSVIQHIAPHLNQREAFAEAVLFEALQTQKVRDRFQVLASIDGRRTLSEVVRQVWSDVGDARHDLILRTKKGQEFRVELKGNGPFTQRQVRALERGNSASDSIRIDVLVHPALLHPPTKIHETVKCLTWDQIDHELLLGKHPLGRLADLWRNSSKVSWANIAKDARAFMAYYREGNSTAGWWTLWSSIDYLRSALCGNLRFRRIGGPRTYCQCAYYGAWICRGTSSWWVGWVFTGGQRGRFKAALVLEEGSLPCQSESRGSLPPWYSLTAQGLVLAEMGVDPGTHIIDLDAVADVVKRACG